MIFVLLFGLASIGKSFLDLIHYIIAHRMVIVWLMPTNCTLIAIVMHEVINSVRIEVLGVYWRVSQILEKSWVKLKPFMILLTIRLIMLSILVDIILWWLHQRINCRCGGSMVVNIKYKGFGIFVILVRGELVERMRSFEHLFHSLFILLQFL